MDLRDTLAQLPYDHPVTLRKKGGTYEYVSPAGEWLQQEPDLNKNFEITQPIHLPKNRIAGKYEISPGDHIFNIPTQVESHWGTGYESLWAVGEPLMIYGPTGVGKTTLAGRLLLSLIGVDPPEVLGWPTTPLPDDQNILYIAADRPRQAMRSLRRMVNKQDAPTLHKRLRIEHQRQLWAAAETPNMLYEAAQQTSATIIILDSGKDIAAGPLKEETAAKGLMDAIQVCISNEVDILLLHHPRKMNQDNANKKLDIDDVYGSAWLTAGSGSVLLVAGKPGEGVFQLHQLKAPSTFINSVDCYVDYYTGSLTKRTIRNLQAWIEESDRPISTRQATAFMTGETEENVDPRGAPYKKIEREIKFLENEGTIHLVGKSPNRWQFRGRILTDLPDNIF